MKRTNDHITSAYHVTYAYEDENFEPECCGELMEEVPEEHEPGILVYDCGECGKRKFFNAYTGRDITDQM